MDSIETIGFPDITPELARKSGFLGALDLLKTAKHGRGENIYLVLIAIRPSRPAKRSEAFLSNGVDQQETDDKYYRAGCAMN